MGIGISKNLTNLEELYVVIFFFFSYSQIELKYSSGQFLPKESVSLNALENDVSYKIC